MRQGNEAGTQPASQAETLGDRVRQRREELRWTRRQLAERVCQIVGEANAIGETGIGAIENKASKHPRLIVEIAEALGVSTYWLRKGSNDNADSADRRQVVPVAGYIGQSGLISPVNNGFAIEVPDPMPGGSVAYIVQALETLLGYDDGAAVIVRHKPSSADSLIGVVCVAQIAGGRRHLRRLRLGSEPGIYTLEPIAGGRSIENVPLEAVHKILWVLPPNEWRRLT